MRKACILAIASLLASAASAKVDDLSASGFKITHDVATAATPQQVWKALGRVGRWWDPEHTWSGNARNMSIALKAGGCFCETWDGQSVEHTRVIWAHRDTRLRMLGAFGPLQEWGVSGVSEFVIKPADHGSTIRFSYTVSGDARFKLDAVAPIVEQVLGTQVQRLARYAATGSPAAQ